MRKRTRTDAQKLFFRVCKHAGTLRYLDTFVKEALAKKKKKTG
jgi:hypothetical protein